MWLPAGMAVKDLERITDEPPPPAGPQTPASSRRNAAPCWSTSDVIRRDTLGAGLYQRWSTNSDDHTAG